MTDTASTTDTTDTTDTTGMRCDLLRTVLRLDAAASGALGLLALGGGASGLTVAPLGIGAPVQVGVGAFLVVYATGLVALAAPTAIPRAGAWTVVVGNGAWVLASGAFVLFGGLTALGAAVVLAQGAAVGVLAALQYAGLRRTPQLAARSQRPSR